MKISVLVPVFNVEEYLTDCIESVLKQTHNERELILVDDGSTDKSQDICVRYATQYPNEIKVIRTRNGGPLQARARAMDLATGDVFVFLDSDDCLRNDTLAKVNDCFERELCDMVMFNTGESPNFPTIQSKYHFKNGQVWEGATKKELYHQIVVGKVSNSVCSKAVRASCAQIPPSFYQCNAKHGEDLLLSVHFLTNCKKIVFIEEGLYFYRNRPGSAIHSFNPQRKHSIKTVHIELEKYIDQWGMPELKPLHNARKIKGWIENLKFLLKSRDSITKKEFKTELRDISKDSYFISAYKNMDQSMLSFGNRVFAYLLYTKQYWLISLSYCIIQKLKKVKVKKL